MTIPMKDKSRDVFIFGSPCGISQGIARAIFESLGNTTVVILHFRHKSKGVEKTKTRKPMLLLRLSGLLLLRYAQRALF